MLKNEKYYLALGFANRDPESTKEFLNKYKGKIDKIAHVHTRNHEDAKDLSIEILGKIHHNFQNPNALQKIRNLDAWITKVAKNYCVDHIKKTRQERSSRIDFDVSQVKDTDKFTQPEERFIKEEKENRESNLTLIAKLENLNLNSSVGLEISLDYIYRIYNLKNKISSCETKLPSLIDTINYFKSVRNTPKNILNFLGEASFENLNKSIEKQIEALESQLRTDSIYIEFISFYADFDDFFKKIPGMRIDPVKMIFKVWHKALRKGKYTRLTFIKNLLLEFKGATKGTEKEFLFDSITSSLNINTLRKKSIYKNYKLKDFYDRLADYIYKKSFIEQKRLIE